MAEFGDWIANPPRIRAHYLASAFAVAIVIGSAMCMPGAHAAGDGVNQLTWSLASVDGRWSSGDCRVKYYDYSIHGNEAHFRDQTGALDVERITDVRNNGFSAVTVSASSSSSIGSRWNYTFNGSQVRIEDLSTRRQFVQTRCSPINQQVATTTPTVASVGMDTLENIPGGLVKTITRQSVGQTFLDKQLSANGVMLELSEVSLQHYRLTSNGVELEQMDGFPQFQGIYGNYVLLEEGTGGTACPSLYRVIDLSGTPPTLTSQFGSCSDLPTVTLTPNGLRVVTPSVSGPASQIVLISGGQVSTCRAPSDIVCGGIATTSTGMNDDTTAEAFLRRLYQPYQHPGRLSDLGDARADKNAPERLLDPSLAALWRKSQSITRDGPGPIDGDPICSCQEADISALNFSVQISSPNSAVGTVSFNVENRPTILKYQLAKMADRWRISDIASSSNPLSVRQTLEQDIAHSADGRVASDVPDIFSAPTSATIGYGGRAGMEVSVVSAEGLDTDHAVIRTKHTRENAISFCREYVGKITEECISRELAMPLKAEIAANCNGGEFSDFFGKNFRFVGINHDPSSSDIAELAIMDTTLGIIADGSSASSYSVNSDIFHALCPARFEAATEGAKRDRETRSQNNAATQTSMQQADAVGPFSYGFWQSTANGATGPGQCNPTGFTIKNADKGSLIYMSGMSGGESRFPPLRETYTQSSSSDFTIDVPNGGGRLEYRITWRKLEGGMAVRRFKTELLDTSELADEWGSLEQGRAALSQGDGMIMYKCD